MDGHTLYGMTSITFREATLQDSEPLRVDRAKGVIYGVKLLGFESKNKASVLGLPRSKFGSALDKTYGYGKAKATEIAKRYDRKPINIDHHYKETDRPFPSVFGESRNPVAREDGIYGDIHFLPNHAMADTVCDAAELMPHVLGASHEASGEPILKEGRVIIEDWEPVSVDLVSRPATTNGLFEGQGRNMPAKQKTIREIIRGQKDKELSALLKEMETADMIDGAVLDAPVESGEPEDQLRSALMAMLTAKVESASPEEVKKLLKALGMEDSLTAALTGKSEKKSEPPADDEPADEPTDEDKAMEESIKKENRELKAKMALLESGRKATEVRVAALMGVDESMRPALIESWERDAVGFEQSTKQRITLTGPSPPKYTVNVGDDVQVSESFRSKIFKVKV